jgi:hypothetical protein
MLFIGKKAEFFHIENLAFIWATFINEALAATNEYLLQVSRLRRPNPFS